MPQAVSCKGFLREKNDSFLKSWTSFYFTLAQSRLSKYKTPKDNIPIEHFEISNKTVSAVTDADLLVGKKYSIAIFLQDAKKDGKNPIILRAETAEEKNLWLVNLKSYLEASPTPSVISGESDPIVKTMESIIDACVITDDKAVIMGFNKAAEALFGYTKAEVVGKNVAGVIMPAAYVAVHDQVRYAHATFVLTIHVIFTPVFLLF